MAKLHEVLAVEPDIEGAFKKVLAETIDLFTRKPAHLTAFIKKLDMFEETGVEYPEERLAMVTTVPERLEYFFKFFSNFLDIKFQKEATNQNAKADIVVDGTTIKKDVPATYLLALETILKNLRPALEAIPTLQPGIDWDLDDKEGEGVYKAKYPVKKMKTAKTFEHKILVGPTDKHPAQVEKWEETKNVGTYITDTWSGMISSAEKSAFLLRLDKLIQEVKKARQRANTTEVVKSTVGQEIENYLLDK